MNSIGRRPSAVGRSEAPTTATERADHSAEMGSRVTSAHRSLCRGRAKYSYRVLTSGWMMAETTTANWSRAYSSMDIREPKWQSFSGHNWGLKQLDFCFPF